MSARGPPERQLEAFGEPAANSGSANDALEVPHTAAVQEQVNDHSQPATNFYHPVPQYPGLNNTVDVESSGDLLFAELFGGGGLGPSNLANQRADLDWFYQADSLAL